MRRSTTQDQSPAAPATGDVARGCLASGSGRRSWLWLLAGGAAILAMTILAYLPALHDGFIWDDDSYVTANTLLRSLPGLKTLWFDVRASAQYYPLVYTTFWIEYHCWGLNPLPYHLDNMLLQGLTAIGLWRVLVRLDFGRVPKMGTKLEQAQRPADGVFRPAWFAAAIFAVHPVGVESVAWVTERKNVLMGLLYMAVLLAYLRFDPLTQTEANTPTAGGASDQPECQNRRRRWAWYGMALFAFVGALLAKTAAVSLPIVILILIWWKRGRIGPAAVARVVPFLLIALPAGLLTSWLEKNHVGAAGARWSLTPVQHVLVAGRILWFYAGKVLWPAHLYFIYPRWEADPGVWWQWLFPAGALVVVAGLWIVRGLLGRGPLAAVGFFVVTLGPVLGFFSVYFMRYSFVNDHFQYIASIGIIVLIVGAISSYLPRLGPAGLWLAAIAGAIILLGLGWKTSSQTHIYRDLETLWRDTTEQNPRAAVAYSNLGLLLRDQGKTDAAIDCFQKAIEANPDHFEAHTNLGVLLWGRHDEAGAIAHERKAIATNPDDADAQANLGFMLAAQGNLIEAIEHDRAAIQVEPLGVNGYNNLGLALVALGKPKEAVKPLTRAAELSPQDPGIHDNLGQALLSLGDFEQAIFHFRRAVELRASDPVFNNDLMQAVTAKELHAATKGGRS